MENNKGERGGVSGGRDRGRVGCGNGGGGGGRTDLVVSWQPVSLSLRFYVHHSTGGG